MLKSYISLIVLFVIFSQTTLIRGASSELSENDLSPLVTTTWLDEHLSDSSLVILHLGRKNTFESGHIPGSILISIRDFMVIETSEDLLHEMPPLPDLKALFESIGINNQSVIVICYEDEMLVPSATRLYLTLDVLGFDKRIAILDGGLKQWKSENRNLSKMVLVPKKGKITFSPRENILVDTEWVYAHYEEPNVYIIDGRPTDHYTGHENPHDFPREGHIKGSYNIPFYDLVREDSTHLFKTRDKLQEMFYDIGVSKKSLIITYCNTGFWAGQVYFIAKFLGYDVRFYDGSFQTWSENEKLPVTGPVSIR